MRSEETCFHLSNSKLIRNARYKKVEEFKCPDGFDFGISDIDFISICANNECVVKH